MLTLFRINRSAENLNEFNRPSSVQWWTFKSMDHEVFHNFIASVVIEKDLLGQTMGLVTTSCDACTHKASYCLRRKPAYFVKEEVFWSLTNRHRASHPDASLKSTADKAAKPELRGAIKCSNVKWLDETMWRRRKRSCESKLYTGKRISQAIYHLLSWSQEYWITM